MTRPGATDTDAEAIVYLPVESADPEAEAVLELRPTEDGQTVMLACSSLDQLVTCCGEYQPWIAMPASAVPGLIANAGADGVVWDQPLSPAQRHGPEGFEDDDGALRTAIGNDVISTTEKGTDRGY